MGAHIPRIVSPAAGQDVALAATGKMVRQDEANLRRCLYFGFVWAMVAIGVSILLVGFTQPLPLALLVVSSSLSGLVMVVYSAPLIQLNRKALPAALKVRGFRLGVMIVAVLFYGYFSARLVISYGGLLFG
jgi:hypothetical protein